MGCYLLIILSEPICKEHKEKILQRVAKGLLSWDSEKTECDLMEVEDVLQNKLSKNNIEISEILLQYSNDKLAIEVLLNPQIYTLKQCLKNLLLSPTVYKHIIHAGYSFSGTGSWMCDDGVFEFQHFIDTFRDKQVENFFQSFPYGFITVHIHCAPIGHWVINDFKSQSFSKYVKVELNPADSSHGVKGAASLLDFFDASLMQLNLEAKMSPTSVVGNIRFERPTLYVFPSGQGNCSLFGITGFTMLIDGGFTPVPSFWNFIRHLERLDAIMVTRLNEDNLWGVSSLFKKKALHPVYPQIGYIFCNIAEGHANGLTEKKQNNVENKELVISVIEVGQELLENLKHVGLNPLHCLREPLDTIEPMVLYHKVGHGTLEMYILSPPRDSRILNEFLEHWNASKESFSVVRTSSASVNGSDIAIPISNIMSICCLLIWRPYDKNDTIARMLFPGSAPQSRIFEGLERVKKLSILQHQTCTQQTILNASNAKTSDQISRFSQKSRFRSASPIFRKKPKQQLPHDKQSSIDAEKGGESSDASLSPKQKQIFQPKPQKPPQHQQNAAKNVQQKSKVDKQEQPIIKKEEKLLSAKKPITRDTKKDIANDKRKPKSKSRAKESAIKTKVIAPSVSPPKTDDTDDEVLKITLTMNGYDNKTDKTDDTIPAQKEAEPMNVLQAHPYDSLKDDVEPDSLDSHSHEAVTEMCRDSLDVSEDESYVKSNVAETAIHVEHNDNIDQHVDDKGIEPQTSEETVAEKSADLTVDRLNDESCAQTNDEPIVETVECEELNQIKADNDMEINKQLSEDEVEIEEVLKNGESIDEKNLMISNADVEIADQTIEECGSSKPIDTLPMDAIQTYQLIGEEDFKRNETEKTDADIKDTNQIEEELTKSKNIQSDVEQNVSQNMDESVIVDKLDDSYKSAVEVDISSKSSDMSSKDNSKIEFENSIKSTDKFVEIETISKDNSKVDTNRIDSKQSYELKTDEDFKQTDFKQTEYEKSDGDITDKYPIEVEIIKSDSIQSKVEQNMSQPSDKTSLIIDEIKDTNKSDISTKQTDIIEKITTDSSIKPDVCSSDSTIDTYGIDVEQSDEDFNRSEYEKTDGKFANSYSLEEEIRKSENNQSIVEQNTSKPVESSLIVDELNDSYKSKAELDISMKTSDKIDEMTTDLNVESDNEIGTDISNKNVDYNSHQSEELTVIHPQTSKSTDDEEIDNLVDMYETQRLDNRPISKLNEISNEPEVEITSSSYATISDLKQPPPESSSLNVALHENLTVSGDTTPQSMPLSQSQSQSQSKDLISDDSIKLVKSNQEIGDKSIDTKQLSGEMTSILSTSAYETEPTNYTSDNFAEYVPNLSEISKVDTHPIVAKQTDELKTDEDFKLNATESDFTGKHPIEEQLIKYENIQSDVDQNVSKPIDKLSLEKSKLETDLSRKLSDINEEVITQSDVKSDIETELTTTKPNDNIEEINTVSNDSNNYETETTIKSSDKFGELVSIFSDNSKIDTKIPNKSNDNFGEIVPISSDNSKVESEITIKPNNNFGKTDEKSDEDFTDKYPIEVEIIKSENIQSFVEQNVSQPSGESSLIIDESKDSNKSDISIKQTDIIEKITTESSVKSDVYSSESSIDKKHIDVKQSDEDFKRNEYEKTDGKFTDTYSLEEEIIKSTNNQSDVEQNMSKPTDKSSLIIDDLNNINKSKVEADITTKSSNDIIDDVSIQPNVKSEVITEMMSTKPSNKIEKFTTDAKLETNITNKTDVYDNDSQQIDKLYIIQPQSRKSIDDHEFDTQSTIEPKSKLHEISNESKLEPASSSRQSTPDIAEYSKQSSSLNVTYPEMLTLSGNTTSQSMPLSQSQSMSQSKDSISYDSNNLVKEIGDKSIDSKQLTGEIASNVKSSEYDKSGGDITDTYQIEEEILKSKNIQSNVEQNVSKSLYDSSVIVDKLGDSNKSAVEVDISSKSSDISSKDNFKIESEYTIKSTDKFVEIVPNSKYNSEVDTNRIDSKQSYELKTNEDFKSTEYEKSDGLFIDKYPIEVEIIKSENIQSNFEQNVSQTSGESSLIIDETKDSNKSDISIKQTDIIENITTDSSVKSDVCSSESSIDTYGIDVKQSNENYNHSEYEKIDAKFTDSYSLEKEIIKSENIRSNVEQNMSAKQRSDELLLIIDEIKDSKKSDISTKQTDIIEKSTRDSNVKSDVLTEMTTSKPSDKIDETITSSNNNYLLNSEIITKSIDNIEKTTTDSSVKTDSEVETNITDKFSYKESINIDKISVTQPILSKSTVDDDNIQTTHIDDVKGDNAKSTADVLEKKTESIVKQRGQSIADQSDYGYDNTSRKSQSKSLSIEEQKESKPTLITDLDANYDEEVFNQYIDYDTQQTNKLTVIHPQTSKSTDDDEFDNLVDMYEIQQLDSQYNIQPKSKLYEISNEPESEPSSSSYYGSGAYVKQSPQDITEYSIESSSLNVAFPEMINVSDDTSPQSTPSSQSQSLYQSKESIDDDSVKEKLAKTSQDISSKPFDTKQLSGEMPTLEYPFILPMSSYGSGATVVSNTESSKNISEDKEIKIIEAQSDIETDFDITSWGKPLKLPTIPDPKPSKSSTQSKPKTATNNTNNTIIYVDLAYVPHHADQHYCNYQYFQTIRARYYVFSGIDPHRQVFDALIEGKKLWSQKFQTTVIPTHDSETLSYWIANNQDMLREHNIDVAPAANRCTVNLQNHDTKCSAYRVEL